MQVQDYIVFMHLQHILCLPFVIAVILMAKRINPPKSQLSHVKHVSVFYVSYLLNLDEYGTTPVLICNSRINLRMLGSFLLAMYVHIF